MEAHNTSLITILSSTHGRLRREQRDIDKRDLKKALKYGKPEKSWGRRWSIDYDGITFITDPSMRQEVTAFPSPLPRQEVSLSTEMEHRKTIELLMKKPTLSTSHTVIIIDNSGSMLAKKNNIYLYRDSQHAAVSMTALEFVAEQIFSQSATNSDLATLILFSSSAKVVVKCEPIGWVVGNKNYFGKGAERVAFRCRLSDTEGVTGFAFKAMVAKETKDIERQDEMESFHASFMETQDLASYLAGEFNRHVRALPQYLSIANTST